jgi:long-chain acyl-CoA synthetase
MYDKVVFRKFKNFLGGNIRLMLTGSAPISEETINFLKVCFCCPVIEGYGLTETSAGSCATLPFDPIAGHVGGPLACVKARLRDIPDMKYMTTDVPPRGEICFKGPSISSGYFKNPEQTAKAFDAEGWFLTGDVAEIRPNGSVKIVDRAKNIFKLS